MKYSFIIAIYNRKEELNELLLSLSVQNNRDFEVLVIDDGSSQDLRPIVDFYKDSLDVQFYRKSNSGPGLTRNYGAQFSRGEWLIFLDSDVIVEPDYLVQVNAWLTDHTLDAFGGADKAHPGFNIFQKAVSYAMTSPLTTGGVRGSKRGIGRFQPRSFNMGVKRSVFLEIGGFSDMRIGEDPDLSMTLWEYGFKTDFIPNISVFHKRRTDWKKFSTQVYQFGIARPILNLRHPRYTKLSYWFPSFFLLGFILAIVHSFFFHFPWTLMFYGLYTLMIFVHSLWTVRNISVAYLALQVTYVQMFSYGYGFLESFVKINLLRKDYRKAFPKHFYQ